MQIISDLLITFAVAVVGALFGWLLQRSRRPVEVPAEPGDAAHDVGRAREALDQLHELASKVAFDVGQHHHRVEAISEELAASKDQTSGRVSDAVAKLVQANQQLQQRLASAEVKLQEQAWLVESHAAQARTDALTGLNNRRAFDDALSQGVAEFTQAGRPLGVVMMDIDHFKKFNDTHGHQAGDEVLHRVAGALRDTLSRTALVARYGGEEFAAIFAEADLRRIGAAVERARKAIASATFHYSGVPLHVTCSFGAACLQKGEDGAAVTRRADEALYASKKQGRNRTHGHTGQEIICLTETPPPPAAAPAAAVAPLTAQAAAEPAAPPAEASRSVEPALEPEPAAEPAGPAPRSGPQFKLRNRTAFCVTLGSQMSDWRCGGPAPAVLLLRVDGRGGSRTRLAAEAAVQAFNQAGQLLAKAVCRLDLLAQYDAHTFAVLLPSTGVTQAVETAERIRALIASHSISAANQALRVTMSVGVAEALDTDSLERVLRRANDALDEAVHQGGDCVFYHTGTQCAAGELLTAENAQDDAPSALPEEPAAADEPGEPADPYAAACDVDGPEFDNV